MDSDSYLIPIRKPIEDESYEVPIKPNTQTGPAKKGAGGSDELYDDVLLEEEDDKGISKSHSLGFEPAVSASDVNNKKASKSDSVITVANLSEIKEIKYSNLRQLQQSRSKFRNIGSDEKMKRISEDEAESKLF